MPRSRSLSEPSTSAKPRGRGAARFKRSEARRLVRAAADAGLAVRSFEVDPITGALRVFVGKEGGPSNDLDNWLKKKDAHQA